MIVIITLTNPTTNLVPLRAIRVISELRDLFPSDDLDMNGLIFAVAEVNLVRSQSKRPSYDKKEKREHANRKYR